MQRIVYELPSPDCEIVALTDTHIGGTLCHNKGIDRAKQYIMDDPYRVWLHLGDWIGAITSDDPRWDYDTVKIPTPIEQAKYAIKKFKPIAKRALVGLQGNHERRLHRFGDITKEICDGLKIPYGTYSCRIIFTHKKKTLFKMYATHGNLRLTSNAKDWEQRQANMRATLKMRLQGKMGDCAVMVCGDAHKLLTVPPSNILYLSDGEGGVKQHYLKGAQSGEYIDPNQRWYACCGSFERLAVDGVSGYAERAMLDPVRLGFVSIVIRGGVIQELKEVEA